MSGNSHPRIVVRKAILAALASIGITTPSSGGGAKPAEHLPVHSVGNEPTVWSQIRENSLGLSAGLLLGLVGPMVSSSYILRAALCFLTLAGFLIWLWGHFTNMKAQAFLVFIFVVMGVASWFWLIHPSVEPAGFNAYVPMRPSDLTGNTYAGIVWRESYTQVDLIIDNPSRYDYSDIDFTVSSKNEIAGVGQPEGAIPCTAIPGAEGGLQFGGLTVTTTTGGVSHTDRVDNNSPFAIANNQVVDPGPKRISCPKIAKGSHTHLILAVTNATGKPSNPVDLVFKGSYSAANREMKIDTKNSAWEIRLP